MQGLLEGVAAALADDVRAAQDLGLSGQGQRAARRIGVQRPQLALAQCSQHRGGRHIAANGGQPETQTVLHGDLLHHRHGGLQLGPGTGGAGTADDQRHAGLERAEQHQFKVALDHALGCGHAARAQVIRAGVDGAHVATDEVRLALQAARERGFGNAKTQLPRGRQDAQGFGARAVRSQQPAGGGGVGGGQSTTSRKGACCWAPYTSPSPGSPATHWRGIENFRAEIAGRSKRRTWLAGNW